jgi:predicted GIY-YIG superfamily endonuclease
MKNKKRNKGKHKSLRGLLVKGYLEKVSSKLFELIEDKLSELLKKQSGIYVLYKNNSIYYIGLAKSLRSRLKGHLEDRHKNKWNKFSLYIVKRIRYLRDIESLMLQLVRPKGNKIIGRFEKHGNLKPKIKKELNDLQRALNKAKE